MALQERGLQWPLKQHLRKLQHSFQTFRHRRTTCNLNDECMLSKDTDPHQTMTAISALAHGSTKTKSGDKRRQ